MVLGDRRLAQWTAGREAVRLKIYRAHQQSSGLHDLYSTTGPKGPIVEGKPFRTQTTPLPQGHDTYEETPAPQLLDWNVTAFQGPPRIATGCLTRMICVRPPPQAFLSSSMVHNFHLFPKVALPPLCVPIPVLDLPESSPKCAGRQRAVDPPGLPHSLGVRKGASSGVSESQPRKRRVPHPTPLRRSNATAADGSSDVHGFPNDSLPAIGHKSRYSMLTSIS